MTRAEIKRQCVTLYITSGVDIVGLVDDIIDVAVDEAVERISNRAYERRSTERRVGFERNKKP